MFSEERLELFQGMIGCCHELYLWEYDRDMDLLKTNCPDAAMLNDLLSIGNTKEQLISSAEQCSKPIIMTNKLGNMWIAVPEKDDGNLRRVHVLGPFFIDDIVERELEKRLRELRLSPRVREGMLRFFRNLPVISLSRAMEYAIMLYYCLTGERITIGDLHYRETELQKARPVREEQKADVHGTYEMEQEMLRMVREGDLNIQKHMSKLAVTGSMGKMSNDGDAMRQMKNAVLVCIVLFSRAAIEGGLSPETSLTMTDRYFQSVEACRSLPELQEITKTMQDDFVQRVHRCRARKYSALVMECCDYISLHVEEELSLKQVAADLKYSEYYLSHKFKEETGMTFREYLLRQKLERAKALLRDNSLTVRDISEKLHFCSPSYFTESFRKVCGLSPSQWREQN